MCPVYVRVCARTALPCPARGRWAGGGGLCPSTGRHSLTERKGPAAVLCPEPTPALPLPPGPARMAAWCAGPSGNGVPGGARGTGALLLCLPSAGKRVTWLRVRAESSLTLSPPLALRARPGIRRIQTFPSGLGCPPRTGRLWSGEAATVPPCHPSAPHTAPSGPASAPGHGRAGGWALRMLFRCPRPVNLHQECPH